MTHRGEPQTFLSALPKLIKLSQSPGKARVMLGCNGQPHLHPPSEAARDVASLDWSHCPLDLLAAPHFVACRQLDRLATISPLSGWPGDYAAWTVAGVLALRGA